MMTIFLIDEYYGDNNNNFRNFNKKNNFIN